MTVDKYNDLINKYITHSKEIVENNQKLSTKISSFSESYKHRSLANDYENIERHFGKLKDIDRELE